MRPEDGDVLGDVLQNDIGVAGGAHENQRFGGQVDVFFVFHDVRRNGFVTQLGQFDADFVGRRLVGAAAHDGPVAFADALFYRSGDGVAAVEQPLHALRNTLEMPEPADDLFIAQRSQKTGEIKGQHLSGDHLGIKGFGGSDRHFNVPSVAGIKDAVRRGGDVGLAAVDDGENLRAALPGHGHGPVGVGGGSGLCNGDDQRIRQILPEAEAAQLGCNARLDVEAAAFQAMGQRIRHRLARHRRRSVADDTDILRLAALQAVSNRSGNDVLAQIEQDLRRRRTGVDDPVFTPQCSPDRQAGF